MKRILILIIILVLANLSADLNFGKDLYNDHLYEEAIKEFEKVISESPTSEAAQEAVFYIGKSYRDREQFAMAESSFKKLTEAFPDNKFREEVLFNLALMQFEQKKYEPTIQTIDKLLTKHPLSEFTKKSLAMYLQCYYELGEYSVLIEKGQKFIRNYEGDSNIPDVLLILSKGYFAANIPAEGRKTLNRIFSEFPNQNAAWKAVELEVDLIEKSDGIAAAAELLSQKISKDIPRFFEEPLRLKLANYYLQLGRYDKAYSELDKLITKFNSSAELDNYIVIFSECQLKLNRSTELINDYKDFKKVFRESSLKALYLLKIAEVYLMLNDVQKARDFIAEAKLATNKESDLYECDLLEAGLALKENQLTAAVQSYKKLLESPYADKNELLMLLGDIYFEKFEQYGTAAKFYQQIITGYSSLEILQTAHYKVALCYEKQDKFDLAISELEQISPENLNDPNMAKIIEQKLDYLKKYKNKDYEKAFNDLLDALVVYSNNSDKQSLQDNLIQILSTDLKDYEKAIALLENDNQYEAIYTKAKLYLKLIAKLKSESRTYQVNEKTLELQNLILKLDSSRHARWIAELQLKLQLIENAEINSTLAFKLNDYISTYPDGEVVNEFRYLLFQYNLDAGETSKAAAYAALLQNDGTIPEIGFYEAKITLGEDYYEKDLDDQALRNYRIADAYIDLKKTGVFFHYAVALNETGNTREAKDKLAFLINNGGNFAGFDTVITYFSGILRSLGEYEQTIKYELMLPEEKRTDEFWLQLANDYLTSGDKENGKLALMHIVDKDYQTLYRLGILQYETGEFEMAKYTFGELSKQNKKDLKNYEILGKIAYLQEDYLEAATQYKAIIDKLGDKFSDYDGIVEIAKENIIALYRIENRPKAETLTDRFRKLFTEEEINEIELNRGIYHIELDKKKAEKIFSGLIKGKYLTDEVRIKAYFWRGLLRLESKDMKGAEEDFTTVANSSDKKMSNQAHFKLGTINFSNEKYREALDHYYIVIQNDEDGALALDAARNFAFVCKTIEEWDKAIAAYQIIIERWGDQKLEGETLFDIAFCHYRDKKYDKAAEMFGRAIPLLQDTELQAEAQYWIGESYFGMENYETAVAEFLKVGYNYAEYTQWAASAELKVGESYVEMRNIEKARRMYERIIDRYGKNSQWGTEAQKRLGNL
ncbi:MAG: tetratricopeptide repeat protein [Candidatus Cloacimonadales bacterium]|nr:tetratricopeptide repeat protein [Candidatus Cloacimonadales bacterium]